MSGRLSIPLLSARKLTIPVAILSLALGGCSSNPSTPPAAQQSAAPAAPAATPATLESTDADSARQTTALALPNNFGRFTGDWDEIVKRGALRVLVVTNKTGFFYDKGRPRGAMAEIMEEFGTVINKKLKTGTKKFVVVYLPMPQGSC